MRATILNGIIDRTRGVAPKHILIAHPKIMRAGTQATFRRSRRQSKGWACSVDVGNRPPQVKLCATATPGQCADPRTGAFLSPWWFWRRSEYLHPAEHKTARSPERRFGRPQWEPYGRVAAWRFDGRKLQRSRNGHPRIGCSQYLAPLSIPSAEEFSSAVDSRFRLMPRDGTSPFNLAQSSALLPAPKFAT